MAIEFCHCCHEVTQCRVISGHRYYFENPYMNAYVRTRRCDKCGGGFKTYEIGEPSFNAMREMLSRSKGLSEFIDATWSTTKKEFEERRKFRDELDERKFEQ